MSGAGFILAISLVVAVLLAVAFAAVAFYDRARRAAWWFAASYSLVALSLGLDILAAAFSPGLPGAVATAGGFLAANLLFNAGLAVRGGVKTPWAAMAALFAASLAADAVVFGWPEASALRQGAEQLPFALMCATGFAILVRSPVRSSLDAAFTVLMGAATLQFPLKFLLAVLAGDGALPPQASPGVYALVSLSLVTVFAVALALGMLVLLVRDSLHDAFGRSETDALSGLLNRAGLERHSSAALAQVREHGMPLALVLADLDHFKAVNDTFGHAGGDRVIAHFAALLREAGGREARVARIGGEEFAVLLPGAALGAARLWAEGARAALAAGAVDGLPGARRFTASFGAAEWRPGESLAELMHRADGALYEAKAAGRDCVRLSVAYRSDRWERGASRTTSGKAGPAMPGTPPARRRYRDASAGR